jgi:hypothetical protein
MNSPSLTLLFVQISKICRDSARCNEVWRPLFLKKWPLQNSKLKIKSWFKMYERRFKVERKITQAPTSTQHFIGKKNPVAILPKSDSLTRVSFPSSENCDLEFECPLIYESLKKQNDSGTRHCSKCDKTVYEGNGIIIDVKHFKLIG